MVAIPPRTRWHNPSPEEIGATPVDFLHLLDDCTIIDIDGRDPSRTRVISTLVHGNEPSGLIAVHRWLSQDYCAQTNLRFVIASVGAARYRPYFSRRFLPGDEDLNRCFDRHHHTRTHQRALQIKGFISEVNPELVVDLHNTSGVGPAFCVARADGPRERALISFFCPQMILTGLTMGSLMEQHFGCPIVTIECGGATDPGAHEVAYHGLKALAHSSDYTQGDHYQPIDVITRPIRVEVLPGVTLGYGQHNRPELDLCIIADIESRNMDITPAGSCLGWTNYGAGAIICRDEQGVEPVDALFTITENAIVTSCDLRLFMATTRGDIALNDCLFYAVIL